MNQKFFLELSDVNAMLAAAQDEALKNNWAVTIAIVDDGGHLLGLRRLDGAPAISAHIAPAKAHTAALGRRESKVYEDVINGGRTSFLSAPVVQGMLEGGVDDALATLRVDEATRQSRDSGGQWVKIH